MRLKKRLKVKGERKKLIIQTRRSRRLSIILSFQTQDFFPRIYEKILRKSLKYFFVWWWGFWMTKGFVLIQNSDASPPIICIEIACTKKWPSSRPGLGLYAGRTLIQVLGLVGAGRVKLGDFSDVTVFPTHQPTFILHKTRK